MTEANKQETMAVVNAYRALSEESRDYFHFAVAILKDEAAPVKRGRPRGSRNKAAGEGFVLAHDPNNPICACQNCEGRNVEK